MDLSIRVITRAPAGRWPVPVLVIVVVMVMVAVHLGYLPPGWVVLAAAAGLPAGRAALPSLLSALKTSDQP